MILPIALVTITGAQPNQTRDLQTANDIYSSQCGIFVELADAIEVDRPDLLVLDQTDCLRNGHVVSADEDELFQLGRSLGADVVGYYVQGDAAGFRGCAAHPPDRRGFWVGDIATQWTMTHEATHVVGGNPHVGDTDNLMFGNTGQITNPPPGLTDDQCARILADPALLCISSIVLNL